MKYRVKAGVVLPITDMRRINMVTFTRVFCEVCLDREIPPLSTIEAALAVLLAFSFWGYGPLICSASIGSSVAIFEVNMVILLSIEVVTVHCLLLLDLVTDFVLQKRMTYNNRGRNMPKDRTIML